MVVLTEIESVISITLHNLRDDIVTIAVLVAQMCTDFTNLFSSKQAYKLVGETSVRFIDDVCYQGLMNEYIDAYGFNLLEKEDKHSMGYSIFSVCFWVRLIKSSARGQLPR